MREAGERLAWELLVRHGVERPPVDIDRIAAAEGMRFIPADFDTSLGAYSRIFNPDARAAWARQPFAMIGSHQHPLRQRFTKAHELAHHLIDEPTGWIARMQLPLPTRYKGLNTYHLAHELFAASLLMPRPWVLAFFGASRRVRAGDVVRFADYFAVTKIAARARIYELHIEAVGRTALLLPRSRGRHESLYGAA